MCGVTRRPGREADAVRIIIAVVAAVCAAFCFALGSLVQQGAARHIQVVRPRLVADEVAGWRAPDGASERCSWQAWRT
jgi:hypothetical protein